MMELKQKDFFDIVHNKPIATVEVFRLSDGNWQAQIFDGWYMAIRSTREAAIKAVEKAYHSVMDGVPA